MLERCITIELTDGSVIEVVAYLSGGRHLIVDVNRDGICISRTGHGNAALPHLDTIAANLKMPAIMIDVVRGLVATSACDTRHCPEKATA